MASLNWRKWIPFKRKDKSLSRRQEGNEMALAHPLSEMRREIDRIFDQVLRDPFATFDNSFDRWFGDYSAVTFSPRIDVADEKQYLRITAELPGLDQNDIEVSFQDDVLVLRGEKRVDSTSEESGYYRTECSFGAFERAIPLPVSVDPDRAEASFKKGVLTIRLPKVGQSAAKRIEVRAA